MRLTAPSPIGDRALPTEWAAVAAAVGLLALGRLTGLGLLSVAGAAAAAVVIVVAFPEVVVAVFLASGTLKANPMLAGMPGDLTLLSAGGVAVAMLVRVHRDGAPQIPRSAALFGALVGLMLLSVLWSPDPATGLRKVQTFETLTLISFACPFVLFRTRAQVQRLMVILVAVGLFVSLTAVRTGHQAAPLVAAGGNEIELAQQAAVGVLAALGYLLLVGRSPLRMLWVAPAALLCMTIVQAGSRGILAGTVLAVAFLTAQAALYRLPGRARLLAAVGTGALVTVIAGDRLAGDATHKYTHYLFGANLDSILIGREWILARGWELTLAHPLGLGAGGFEWATGWEHSHNMFFELSSEQGMVAVVLVIALVAAAWSARLRGPGGRSPESAICGALILLGLVQGLITNGPNDSRPLWFALGLALALPQLRRSGEPPAPPPGWTSGAPVPARRRVAVTS